MSKPFLLVALVICACCGSFIPAALGQAVYGSILGTITDPSGAAVPNATVTVINEGKGTKEVATTNGEGNYSVTHLVPDAYTVNVEAQGFKITQQKLVQVSADTGSRVDLQMQLGSTSESVNVTGEAPQLKTDRADVAVQFNEKYVQNLPILNRNFTSFELLSPGTQKLVGWSHAATENPQQSQQIFVNGQHFGGTGYELDGTDNQDPILGIIVVNPNFDAITETKIAMQNFDAEFGKAIAGLVTVQTKSGSNDLHGSGFWYRRTDATQARNPFTQYAPDPVTGRLIPSTRWNQFGGSFGGPIIKNKLFFFADYQGTRETDGQSTRLTIPTAKVLSTCLAGTGFCDLSDYQPLIGNGDPEDPSNYIYDPASSANLQGTGRAAFCGATEVVDPTPANCPTPFLIPVDRLSPQALAFLQLFPQPQNSALSDNFVASGSGPFNQNSFDTRIDYTASQSLSLFGRYSLDYFSISGQPALGALGATGFGQGGLAGSSIIHNHSLAAGFDKVVSPTLLTDFRFGYFKYNPDVHKWDEGTTPASDSGIPNLNLGDAFTSGLPAFFMDSAISDFGDGLGINACNCPLVESEQQFQFVNNWTKTLGNHQIKVGGDVRYAMNLRIPSDANRTGQLTFSGQATANDGLGGSGLATFLLGDVTHFERYVSTSLDAAERQKRFFFYGQDTWRVTPKLSLNYGLRWELYFPETVNGKGKGGFANLTEGVIRVAGYGPYGTNGNVDMSYKAFAPRLGVAYEVTPKTVVRLGYGRSFDIGVFGTLFGHTVTQNLPVLVDQNLAAHNMPGLHDASDDRIPAFTLAAGPPAYNFPDIPSNGQLPLQGPNGDVNPKIRPTRIVIPTLDAWNVSVQHQISDTMSIEATYIGNKGTHVFAGIGAAYNPNQLSIAGFNDPNLTQEQRRPFHNRFSYPGFTDENGDPLTCCDSDLGYLGSDASSNYNALQLKVDKRFSNGLQFLTHYTLAKSMNYTDNYYAVDPRLAYGPDDLARTHVWVMNLVYDLPFGRGKTFGANTGRALDLIVGGWQISGTTNLSTGLPWTPSYTNCDSEEDVGVCMPNKGSGSFHTGAGKFQTPADGAPYVQFFTPVPDITDPNNPAGPFADPGAGNLGNIGRNSFRGPGLFTADMSLHKSFHVSERVEAEFSMDAFNVFNHPVLGFDNYENGGLAIDGSPDGSDGKITDIESDIGMRQLQFGFRLSF